MLWTSRAEVSQNGKVNNMPTSSSRKCITAFTASWEVCEPNYRRNITVNCSTLHFTLLETTILFLCLGDFFVFQLLLWSQCFLLKLFRFWTRRYISFLWYAFDWSYHRRGRSVWHGFRLCGRANFLGLISQLDGSIAPIFFLSVHQITSSFSSLPNVLLILQSRGILNCFFSHVPRAKASLIFKCICRLFPGTFKAIPCQSIAYFKKHQEIHTRLGSKLFPPLF